MCGSRGAGAGGGGFGGGGGGGGGEAGGPDTPPEKSQTYNNSGRDSLKKWKATKLALNVGPLAARMPNTI